MIFHPPFNIPGTITGFLLPSSTFLGFGGTIKLLTKMYFNCTKWAKFGKNRTMHLRSSFDKTDIY